MKKLTPILVAFLAVAPFALPSASTFADTPAASAATATTYRGKVTTVDTTANSITINSKKTGTHTFTTNSSTVVKVDGAASQLSDVQVGMHAMVTSTDGTTAATITAKAGKKKS